MTEEPARLPESPMPNVVPNSPWRRAWTSFKRRVIDGLFVVLPILITCWIIRWLYLFVESYVISPFTALVLWKVRGYYSEEPLPFWFESYLAPVIAILFVVVVLFGLAFIAYSPLHKWLNWVLINIPVFSWIYNPVRKVFETLETHQGDQHGHKKPQRIVLISFPHTGMKVPAIVTATCKDVETQRTILCVYVPTTPVPTSGYFLLVPEEEATEINWDTEQTLQAIISGGLAAPPEVTYFKKR